MTARGATGAAGAAFDQTAVAAAAVAAGAAAVLGGARDACASREVGDARADEVQWSSDGREYWAIQHDENDAGRDRIYPELRGGYPGSSDIPRYP